LAWQRTHKNHGIEGRVILPVADMVELEALLRFALLAAIASASEAACEQLS
jgi:hypothetical protein